jgi:hypothetical protein
MHYRTALLGAAFLALSILPSQGQIRLEMNKITCADLLRYSKPDQDFLRYWMSGYYNAAANNAVFDYDRLQRNTKLVTQYCQKNKNAPLPKAINAVAK